jgi:hypothetical protein
MNQKTGGLMSARRLLSATAIACAIAVVGGVSEASATSRVFFNEHIVLKSYAASGTPRENLYASGGAIGEASGTWKFCTADNPNNTEVLDNYECATGIGFIEDFGTTNARAWIEVKNQSGSDAAHVTGEEFWG